MRKSFKKCKQCTPVAKIHKISPLGESLFKIFYNIPLLHLNIDVTVATFISFFFHLFIHCSLFCLLAITTWLSLHQMIVTCHCWIRDFFFLHLGGGSGAMVIVARLGCWHCCCQACFWWLSSWLGLIVNVSCGSSFEVDMAAVLDLEILDALFFLMTQLIICCSLYLLQ